MKAINPAITNRQFQVNQTVHIKQCPGIVEGYVSENEVVVRLKISQITIECEKYLKQFKCLIPTAKRSRMYVIPENTLMRHNEQEIKTVKRTSKRTRRKS